MAMNTALRKISSPENISAWFHATKCVNGMKPPIQSKNTSILYYSTHLLYAPINVKPLGGGGRA